LEPKQPAQQLLCGHFQQRLSRDDGNEASLHAVQRPASCAPGA
jgi:hypothetical protein